MDELSHRLGAGQLYGLDRVLEPPGAFPQPAWRLDADPHAGPGEVLVDVERLNLDSASFHQLSQQAAGDADAVAAEILRIVGERGKMHNPVTGSGGMLVGRVAAAGEVITAARHVRPGQRIASLISLTLTPLRLRRITDIDMRHGQVAAEGTAVLFASSPWAALPADIPDRIALAALDVAGAPSRTAAMVREGDTVLLIGGGGTSGLLSLHEARRGAGAAGTVVVADLEGAGLDDVRSTGLADHVVAADATDALALRAAVTGVAGEADLTVNMVNVPGTELGSILCTRESGTILFFSMATSFTAAALGAEGVGRATTMVIGNGHMPDMGLTALGVLRDNRRIREIFEQRYGAP
ncbi:MAG TPA: L-erythro-3,5-diaminohexanoate dehydrogenase [Gaiellales bacterium]|nr:L-erythro-3,5-diaminohexanoate dehydrogenase [Gaiellales bacterium]